jgi:hypothetical protein
MQLKRASLQELEIWDEGKLPAVNLTKGQFGSLRRQQGECDEVCDGEMGGGGLLITAEQSAILSLTFNI